MAATQWETCSADALLREFFAQDDLRRLAEGAGALLGCPLLVLDDTFHVAAHHLPLGFSDAVFQASVRSGEITYEAGAIISRSPALSAGALCTPGSQSSSPCRTGNPSPTSVSV